MKNGMVINKDGDKFWYKDYKLHREDGPAVEFLNGAKYWYKNDKLHRADGPAIECADGYKAWYLNGKRHRTGGPAVEYNGGGKYWYIDGKLHREDGPAKECSDGSRFWYINDEKFTEEVFNKLTESNKMKSCMAADVRGNKFWYRGDKLHRTDGPAIEWSSGDKLWYINGKGLTEEEFDKLTGDSAVKNGLEVDARGDRFWYKDDKLHREDGPAVEAVNGYRAWYKDGNYHREDGGPAVEFLNGHKEWYIDGKLHREDGPAIERSHGVKEWYLDGNELTEEDFSKRIVGSKMKNGMEINEDSVKFWCKDDKLHREDEPAIEYVDGSKYWYVNGKKLTEQEFNKRTGDNKVKNGLVTDVLGNRFWYKNDKLHREDGPAIEYVGGCKAWYKDGKYHREDGPAIVWESGAQFWYINGQHYSKEQFNKLTESNSMKNGLVIDGHDNKRWYKNDKLHREDGPAVEWADGNKHWYLNGKQHREDGPAVEYASGGREWYKNGKCHRTDGPAVELNGIKFWYLDGTSYSEEEFKKLTESNNMRNGLFEEADGSKYWYKDGKFHREDGPAVEWASGTKFWQIHGKLHREDGPAIELSNGNKYWYKDGKLHREDEPAAEFANGNKYWYVNGKLHREDGPAMECSDGSRFWYLDGEELTEEEFNKLTGNSTMKNGLVTDEYGDKRWYKNDKLHREDGPAVEYADGTMVWYKNGERHREDGPAAVWPDGTNHWYKNGTYLPPETRDVEEKGDSVTNVNSTICAIFRTDQVVDYNKDIIFSYGDKPKSKIKIAYNSTFYHISLEYIDTYLNIVFSKECMISKASSTSSFMVNSSEANDNFNEFIKDIRGFMGSIGWDKDFVNDLVVGSKTFK